MNKPNISKMIEDTIAEEEKRLDDLYDERKSNFDLIDEKENKFRNFRRRLKKSFFGGFGCGLMLIALVLFFFRPYTTVVEKAPQPAELTDEQIIEKAKELGMVMPSEITPAEIEVTPIDNSVK